MRLPPSSTEAACLERTRLAVLNIAMLAGLGIAVSGLALRPRDRGATLWPPDVTRRAALMGLLGLTVVSFAVRRFGASRAALLDPKSRARRFFWAHVWSAAVAALAVPLGFAYGYAIQPRLEAVAPFWVAALALGFLALPRAEGLEGFREPLQ